MLGVFINWVLSAMAVFTAAYLLSGVHVENFTAALVTALVIGIFNAILKPILIILTLPITILTVGLFTFVIQAILILLTDKIVPGFSVDGFGWALILSLVLAAINFFLHSLNPSKF